MKTRYVVTRTEIGISCCDFNHSVGVGISKSPKKAQEIAWSKTNAYGSVDYVGIVVGVTSAPGRVPWPTRQ